MVCAKCGTQIDGKFCYICGTKNDSAEDAVNDTKTDDDTAKKETEKITEKKAEKENATVSNSADTKANVISEDELEGRAYVEHKIGNLLGKFKNPKVLLITIAAVVAILAAFIIILTYKPSIKVDDYVRCDFYGYESIGKAKITYDFDEFKDDYQNTIEKHINEKAVKKMLGSELGVSAEDSLVAEKYQEFVDKAPELLIAILNGSLDRTSDLSNNDTVIYSWDIDHEFVDEYFDLKIKCDCDGIGFEVEGLEKTDIFDPFDGVELNYKGTSSEGRATFNFTKEIEGRLSLNYSLSVSEGLSNDDVITATVSISGSPTSFVEEYEKVPYPRTKEFKVSGLPVLVENMDSTTDQIFLEVNKKATECLEEDINNSIKGNQVLKNTEYVGNVFLKKKAGQKADSNRCYMVYKLTITTSLKTEDEGWVTDESTVYSYVLFRNMMFCENGSKSIEADEIVLPSETYTIDSQYKDPERWFGGKYELTFKGFENLESISEGVISKDYDAYNYTDNLSSSESEGN